MNLKDWEELGLTALVLSGKDFLAVVTVHTM